VLTIRSGKIVEIVGFDDKTEALSYVSQPSAWPLWLSVSPCGRGEDRICAHIPLRRLGLPDDIATAALFLASDAASWVTG
jgi:NAD(P)-dependent dehydrogenase (short-subunit alcohol dehydrogenase family)